MPIPNNIVRQNMARSKRALSIGAGYQFNDESDRLAYITSRTQEIINNADSAREIEQDSGDAGFLERIAYGWEHLGSSLNNFIYNKNEVEVSNEQERLRLNNEGEDYIEKFKKYMDLYEALQQAGLQDPLGDYIQPSPANAEFKRMLQELRDIDAQINTNYARSSHDFFSNKDFKNSKNFGLYRLLADTEILDLRQDRAELEAELKLDSHEKADALSKIDTRFKLYQENQLGAHTLIPGLMLLELPYVFPEVGSSLQEVKAMVTGLAIDAALSAVTGGLGGAWRAGLRVASGLFNIWNTYRMRQSETNSEAMDALTSRFSQQLQESGINYQDVLDGAKQLLARIGVDSSGFDNNELLSAALAFNIPGSAEYNNLLQEQKEGIVALKDRNDALAVADYLEMLPFMNYGGKFIRNAERKAMQMGAKAMQKGAEKVAPKTMSYLEGRVGRFLHPADIEKAVTRTHKINYLLDKAGQMASIGFKEGLEEGVQSILQQEYERGDYDNGYFGSSLFDNWAGRNGTAILADLELAGKAMTSFLGVDLGYDNDEIRKAMVTGAAASVLFSGLLDAGISNTTSAITGQKGDNLTSLSRQLNTDKQIIHKLLAEQAGKINDSQHIQIFYNSLLNKNGSLNKNKWQYILDTLDTVRNNVDGENVTKDFVDDDILIASTVYNTMSKLEEKPEKSHLASLALKNPELFGKNTTGRLALVEIAATAALDNANVGRAMNESQRDTNQRTDKIVSIVTSDDPSKIQDASADDIQLARDISDAYSQYELDQKTLLEKNLADRSKLILSLQKKIKFTELDARGSVLLNRRESEISDSAVKIAYLFKNNSTYDGFKKALRNARMDFKPNDFKNVKKAFNAYKNGLLSFLDIRAMFDPRLEFDESEGFFEDNKYTKSAFATKYLSAMFGMANLISRYNIFLMAQHQENAQNMVERFLGIDLDKMLLRGMTDYAKEAFELSLRDTLSQRLADIREGFEDIIKYSQDKFNLAAGKYAKIYDVLNANLATSATVGILNNLIQYGNTKLSGLEKIRDLTRDEGNNKNLEEFLKIVSELRLKTDQRDLEPEEERTIDQELFLEDGRKRAISSFIQYLVDKKLLKGDPERKRIAHRKFEDFSEIDTHVTPDEQERVLAGDSETTEIVEKKLKGLKKTGETALVEEAAGETFNSQQPEQSQTAEPSIEQSSKDEVEDPYSVQSAIDDANTATFGETPEDAGKAASLAQTLAIAEGQDPRDVHQTNSAIEEAERLFSESAASAETPGESGVFSETPEEYQLNQIEGDTILKRSKSDVQTSDEAYKDYLSQTLFYDPTSDTQIVLSANDSTKPVKTRFEIGKGKELAKKLLKRGWLDDLYNRGNVYYFVSGNIKYGPNEITKDNFDELTVGILIDDDTVKGLERTFVITFRTPRNVNKDVNKKSLRQRMRVLGLTDSQAFSAYNDAEKRLIDTYKKRTGKQADKFNGEVSAYWNSTDALRKEADDIFYQARRDFNPNVLTDEQIEQQILLLIANRNAIIEQYLQKNGDTYTIPQDPLSNAKKLIPQTITQSNGRIEKSGKLRSVTKVKKFGMSSKISEIMGQLNNVLKFGIGQGVRSEDPYSIFSVFNSNEGMPGVGYSGTLYIYTDGPKTDEVNITLSEIRLSDGLSDIENGRFAFNGDGSLNGNVKPSIAEIALYTMMGRAQGVSNDVCEIISRLILNYGDKTILKHSDNRVDGFLRNKQISVDKGVLKIYLPDKDNPEVGKLEQFTADDLFGDSDQCLENRQRVLLQIARNMHWNTSVEANSKHSAPALNKPFPDLLLKHIQEWFAANPTATEYKIFGSDLLTFAKDDFFENVGTKDRPIMQNKPVNVLAWMLATGKILSTATDDVFFAPFVFANGILGLQNVDGKSLQLILQEEEKKTAEPKKQDDKTKPEKKLPTTKKSEQKEKAGKKESGNKNTADQKQKQDANQESTPSWFDVRDLWQQYSSILLGNTEEKIFEAVIFDLSDPEKNRAKSQNLKAGEDGPLAKTLKEKFKTVLDRLDGSEQALKEAGIKYDNIKGYIEKNFAEQVDQIVKQKKNNAALFSKKPYVLVAIGTNGSVSFTIISKNDVRAYAESRRITKNGEAVVYLSERGRGKFAEAKARRWLSKKLGIDPKDILVLDAIRNASNEERFGAMIVSTNRIREELETKFMLSRRSGRGVQYHEAWHYVNLLLHNKDDRRKLYLEYAKAHNLDRNTSFAEIEEMMAEDFKSYMTLRTGVLKPFVAIYDAVAKLLNLYSNKRLMYSVYKNIKNGKYASVKPDQEDLKEFKNAFKDGVYANYYIPSISKEVIDAIPQITSYNQWYDLADSLAHLVVDNMATDYARAKEVSSSSLQEQLEKIKKLVSLIDISGEKVAVIDKVIENKAAFDGVIKDVMRQFGVKLVDKSGTRENANENKTRRETGDMADNLWSMNSYEFSRKANAKAMAKFFLSFVPVHEPIIGEDGRVTDYEPVYDDILGILTYYDLDYAWNTVLDAMWNVETFDAKDKDGKYLSNSILGIAEKLSKESGFFYALYDRLQNGTKVYIGEDLVPDLQLQAQLLTAIKSSFAETSYVESRSKKSGSKASFLETSASYSADNIGITSKNAQSESFGINKDFALITTDYNTFVRKKTRQWGAFAVSEGLAIAHGGTMKYSEARVKKLNEQFEAIFKGIKGIKVEKSRVKIDKNVDADLVLGSMQKGLVDLFVSMGFIGFDEKCLIAYLRSEIAYEQLLLAKNAAKNADLDQKEIKDYDLMSSEELVKYIFKLFYVNSSNKSGKINYILKQLLKKENSKGMLIKNLPKKIEDLYYGFYLNSLINKLALAQILTMPTRAERKVFDPVGNPIYPVSLNCELTDKLRHLQSDGGELATEMQMVGYSWGSILLDQCLNVARGSSDDVVSTELSLGARDADTRQGIKFKDLTKELDYLNKMQYTQDEDDGMCHSMVLPTMSGKSTFFVIKSKGFNLPHAYTKDAFDVLKRYADSELAAIKDYFKKAHILHVLDHPEDLRDNFHGKIQTTTKKELSTSGQVDKFAKRFAAVKGSRTVEKTIKRLDNSGNGGKFRYFHDIVQFNVDGNILNINEFLDLLWKTLQYIEANPVEFGGLVEVFGDDAYNLDGFELVRLGINRIEEKINALSEQDIHTYFDKIVDLEVATLAKKFPSLVYLDGEKLVNVGIPYQYLFAQDKRFDDLQEGRPGDDFLLSKFGKLPKDFYDSEKESARLRLAIADNVLRQTIATIEVEKVVTGDPAYYKYSYDKSGREVTYTKNGVELKLKIEQISDTIGDKSKRVGLTLSTGENMHLVYSDEVLREHPELGCMDYTVAYTSDIRIKSDHYDFLYDHFLRDRILEYARRNEIEKDIEKLQTAYFDDAAFDEIKEKIGKDKLKDLELIATKDAATFTDVNVCDAQTFVRPDMYRRIKIGLGEWSFVADEDGYSDEEAYNIIMSDPTGKWMKNPAKCAKVSKFLSQPLKMVYFQNAPQRWEFGDEEDQRVVMNIPTTNKQAVFPLFNFLAKSDVGKKLYERMNKQGQEIDMIVMESAVKVGVTQDKPLLYKNSKAKKVLDFNSAEDFNDEILSQQSTSTIGKDNKLPATNKPDGEFNVKIQRIDGLRLQLNTEAHEANSRSVGTQMLKQICGDIEDSYSYDGMLGSEIRSQVTDIVKLISDIGRTDIIGKYSDNNNFVNWVRRTAIGLGLDPAQMALIENGMPVDGASSRLAFQKSLATLVAESTIDIVTFGGSAIQQSVLGLVGGLTMRDEEGKEIVYNQGNDLLLVDKNNATEVMLSMNFFRHIVPKDYKKSYKKSRQWLIDHDYIKGTKSDGTESNPKPVGVGYRIPTQGMSSMFAMTVADVLPSQYGDVIVVPKEFTAQTGSDFDVDKIYIAMKSSNREIPEDSNSLKDLQSKLIDLYIKILTDEKTIAVTRASIDTVTNKIKKEIVPAARRRTTHGYASAFDALSPTSLCLIKQRFLVGKRGVSSMALNITHLALSQSGHFTIPGIEKKYLRTAKRWSIVSGDVSVSKKVGPIDPSKVIIADEEWSREDAVGNKDVLYVFTDNTDRTSGKKKIDPDSWYSKKYRKDKDLKYPTSTAAVVRGLDNARPISTQRYYHPGATWLNGQWQDSDVEEFKSVVRAELLDIVDAWKTDKYKYILFPKGDGLFGSHISNITKEEKPALYDALCDLLEEFGLEKLIPREEQQAPSGWAVESDNSYEVSTDANHLDISKGDPRFSALNAKFKTGTEIDGVDVSGMTIEDVYLNVIKKSGKNMPPSKDSKLYNPELKTKEDKESFSYYNGYLPLWQEWASQNPDLIEELRKNSAGKVLTDKYSKKSSVSQARALYDILGGNSELSAQEQTTDQFGYDTRIFTPFYDAYGLDGNRKSSWLSAMVNAHVDVEKDPYIFDLNVNPVTYDITCLLLRLGQHENTFYFLMQDIIKDYVDAIQVRNNQRLYKKYKESDSEVAQTVMQRYVERYGNKQHKQLDFKIMPKLYVDVLTDAKKNFDNDGLLQDIKHVYKCLCTMMWLNNKAGSMQKAVLIMRGTEDSFGKTLTELYEFDNKVDGIAYTKQEGGTMKLNTVGKFMFNDTFIGTMFENYKDAFTLIANGRFLDASADFQTLYKSIMAGLVGKKYATGSVYRSLQKDLAQLIASRILAIYRNYIIQTHSPISPYNSTSFAEDEKSANYSGPIDVMCGGNVLKIRNHMYDLLYGDRSLVERVANFIEILLREENGSVKVDIGREDFIDPTSGRIINDFLNILLPRTADSSVKFDRLSLAKAYSTLTPREKSKICSGLSVMLMHENAHVRRLARDIVFYNYHTNYNTTSRNSIFDLVPPQFRSLYDTTLSDVLEQSKYDGVSTTSIPSRGIDENAFINTVSDMLARNYWDDDNIVPSITDIAVESLKKDRSHRRNGEYGVIITSRISSAYIKDANYLYKIVGVISRGSVSDAKPKKKGKEAKEPSSLYVYKAIPKLGLIGEGERFAELHNDGSIMSLFGANALPKKFNEKSVDDVVKEMFESDNAEYEKFSKFDAFGVATDEDITIETPESLYVDTNSFHSNIVGMKIVEHASDRNLATILFGNNKVKKLIADKINNAEVLFVHKKSGWLDNGVIFGGDAIIEFIDDQDQIEQMFETAKENAKKDGKKLIISNLDLLGKLKDKVDVIIRPKDLGVRQLKEFENAVNDDESSKKVIAIDGDVQKADRIDTKTLKLAAKDMSDGYRYIKILADVADDYVVDENKLKEFVDLKKSLIADGVSDENLTDDQLNRILYLYDNDRRLYIADEIRKQVIDELMSVDMPDDNLLLTICVDATSDNYEGIAAAAALYKKQSKYRALIILNVSDSDKGGLVKNNILQSSYILDEQLTLDMKAVEKIVEAAQLKIDKLIDDMQERQTSIENTTEQPADNSLELVGELDLSKLMQSFGAVESNDIVGTEGVEDKSENDKPSTSC